MIDESFNSITSGIISRKIKPNKVPAVSPENMCMSFLYLNAIYPPKSVEKKANIDMYINDII